MKRMLYFFLGFPRNMFRLDKYVLSELPAETRVDLHVKVSAIVA
jgi:hypothetical protein